MTGRSLRRRSVGSISGLIVSSRRTRCGVPGLIRTRRTPPDRPVRTVSANPPAETGFFATEVKCAVSYGPRMHAVGAYLLNVHYLPVARTAPPCSRTCSSSRCPPGGCPSLGQKTSLLLADSVVLIKQAVTAATVYATPTTSASYRKSVKTLPSWGGRNR